MDFFEKFAQHEAAVTNQLVSVSELLEITEDIIDWAWTATAPKNTQMRLMGRPLWWDGEYFVIFRRCGYCGTKKHPRDTGFGLFCSMCTAPVSGVGR